MPAPYVQGGAIDILGMVLSGPSHSHDLLRLLKRNGLGLRRQFGKQQLRSEGQTRCPKVCPPAIQRLRATQVQVGGLRKTFFENLVRKQYYRSFSLCNQQCI